MDLITICFWDVARKCPWNGNDLLFALIKQPPSNDFNSQKESVLAMNLGTLNSNRLLFVIRGVIRKALTEDWIERFAKFNEVWEMNREMGN